VKWGPGVYWVFGFFICLNEQLRSLLVDLGHQLSFYLDSSVPQIIEKFADLFLIGR